MREAHSYPIIALLDKILDDAVAAGVNQVELVPHQKWSQVLHYVDGEPKEVMTPTKFAYPALSHRVQLLSLSEPGNPGTFYHGSVPVSTRFRQGDHGLFITLLLGSQEPNHP